MDHFFEWSVPLFFWGGGGALAGVRGERPAGCARDAGRVPLSSRATAKGGQPMTQLAALRQVSSVVQRSHPRAKRNQLPGSRHSRPDARRWHCWEWDARRWHCWEWDARRRHRWEWDARRRHRWEWDARRWHRCFLREIDVSGGAECGKGNYVTGSASRRRRICRLSMRIWRRRGSVLRSCGWIRFLCRSRCVWWRGGGCRTRSGRMRLCCRL